MKWLFAFFVLFSLQSFNSKASENTVAQVKTLQDTVDRIEDISIWNNTIAIYQTKLKEKNFLSGMIQTLPWQTSVDQTFYKSILARLPSEIILYQNQEIAYLQHHSMKISIKPISISEGRYVINGKERKVRLQDYKSAQDFFSQITINHRQSMLPSFLINDAHANYMIPYVLFAGGLLIFSVTKAVEVVSTSRKNSRIELQSQIDNNCGSKGADQIGEKNYRADLYGKTDDNPPKYVSRDACLEKLVAISETSRAIYKLTIGFELDSQDNYPSGYAK